MIDERAEQKLNADDFEVTEEDVIQICAQLPQSPILGRHLRTGRSLLMMIFALLKRQIASSIYPNLLPQSMLTHDPIQRVFDVGVCELHSLEGFLLITDGVIRGSSREVSLPRLVPVFDKRKGFNRAFEAVLDVHDRQDDRSAILCWLEPTSNRNQRGQASPVTGRSTAD